MDTPTETRLRLLLVEDDDGDAFLVREHLEDAGVAVELNRVRSLAEALPLAPDVHCCLVDLGLPDAAGLQAVESLCRAAPDAAIVVLTGLHDAQRGLEAVGAGAQDYLTKGEVDGHEVWRAVRYAVERRRSEQTQRELTLAQQLAAENRRLERGLLPRPIVRSPGFVLGSSYRAGRERALLGGDFFDAIEDEGGTLHLVIGDVCGHGPDEAALGVALRITWRALVLAGVRGVDLLAGMEAILGHERHDPDLFATVCAVAADPAGGRATIHLAGHPPPVLLTPQATPRRLDARSALPIGVPGGGGPATTTVDLPDRWTLMLHTDGLLEGVVDDRGTRLGEERLLATVAGGQAREPGWARAPQALADDIIAACEAQLARPMLDDAAVLLAGWTG